MPQSGKLDSKQASAIDFVVAQDGNFYISGEAALTIELGAYSFLKVKIEDVARSDGDSE